MKRQKRTRFVSAAVTGTLLVLLAASPVRANSTTALLGATGFNIFTLSDFTVSNTDVAGRIGVGGNFNPGNANGSQGFTVVSNQSGTAINDPISAYDFVVAGNLYNNGTQMSGGGSVWVGGNATWNSPTLPGNLVVKGTFTDNGGGSVGGTIYSGSYAGPSYLSHSAITAPQLTSPIDFYTASTQLPALATQLSTNAASQVNKTVNVYNKGVTLVAGSCTLCVINLTSAEVGNALAGGGGGINITAPSGSTVVVNVNGATVNIAGSSITINGIEKNQVLWNFYNATQINYSTVGWQGSILAPIATFTGSGGNIDGQLIVYKDSASTEVHNYLFTGDLPALASSTPEPATWLISLSGLCVFAARRKYRA
jgi:choice-of-anchor A domain-containing protein